ncbi:MAG: hypothetical protein KC414_14290 [Romboutsia sp.]|nr:hypothetical protein [Romboutsia sp.]
MNDISFNEKQEFLNNEDEEIELDSRIISFHIGRYSCIIYKMAKGTVDDWITEFNSSFGDNDEFLAIMRYQCEFCEMPEEWIEETLDAVREKEFFIQIFDKHTYTECTFNEDISPKERYQLIKDKLDEKHILKCNDLIL